MKRFKLNRKLMGITLCCLMFLVFTLSIGYAALSVTLNITGNAQVNATSWDVHLENPIVSSGSVSDTLPSITSNVSATFNATLSKPGDFYEFTIDVVNGGGIAALISGVTKNPTLSESQAKYLNYMISYNDGSEVSSDQLLETGERKTLKVRVEFRSDINASDLPTVTETLNLSFVVNYVQTDDPEEDEEEEVLPPVRLISGDGELGSVIQIGNEQFYIISNENDEIKALAKYNLNAGITFTDATNYTNITDNPPLQNENAKGGILEVQEDWSAIIVYPMVGVLPFSSDMYWEGREGISYMKPYSNVYDSNSNLYEHIESYKTYLNTLGANVSSARTIYFDELETLGCDGDGMTCTSAPEWVYSSSYWSGTLASNMGLWSVSYGGDFYEDFESGYSAYFYGIRPVIVLPSSMLTN